MGARRCVRQSRDVHDCTKREVEHGEQGQEHEEEHGKETGSKDPEREEAGKEGEEVAAPTNPLCPSGERQLATTNENLGTLQTGSVIAACTCFPRSRWAGVQVGARCDPKLRDLRRVRAT